MIEVKTSKKYDDPETKSLESDHKTQFARQVQIFKGTLKVVHKDGIPLELPKKLIYQFSVKKLAQKLKNGYFREELLKLEKESHYYEFIIQNSFRA